MSKWRSDKVPVGAGVKPYTVEISQAGKWLQIVTSRRFNVGTNKGAPALRVAAVLTPHPCTNPQPSAAWSMPL